MLTRKVIQRDLFGGHCGNISTESGMVVLFGMTVSEGIRGNASRDNVVEVASLACKCRGERIAVPREAEVGAAQGNQLQHQIAL